jgi:hypothetical protein
MVGKINAATEEMSEAMFSVRPVPRLCNEDGRVKLVVGRGLEVASQRSESAVASLVSRNSLLYAATSGETGKVSCGSWLGSCESEVGVGCCQSSVSKFIVICCYQAATSGETEDGVVVVVMCSATVTSIQLSV